MGLLTDELKQWIGREFNYTAPEEIGRASIRYFALAIGDDNRLYFDDEYARAAGYAGVTRHLPLSVRPTSMRIVSLTPTATSAIHGTCP